LKYESFFKNYLEAIEAKLDKFLPPAAQYPAAIHEAMRYGVFPGGKRFRPVVTLAAAEAAGGKMENALLPAASLELIHCYSLVHDDLPSLDNDALRRGQPTCHKKFGEAIGVLAGDGLLTLAFHILAFAPAPKAVKYLEEISTAAGSYGMIGGQVADLAAATEEMNLPKLDYISSHKTGQLIKASAVCGAIAGDADPGTAELLLKYGESLGMAFQFIDDLIDGDGYLKVIKPAEVRQRSRELIARAKKAVHPLGAKAEKLQALADFLLQRMPEENHVALDR
jgi:geranylgeranyl diphosphate synthase type II